MRDAEPVAQKALTEWFQSDGDAVEVEALKNSLLGLLPGVEIASWAQKPCVITNTASGHPYIGWVEDGVAVAVGGCGSAAKSSDELGRLASELFKSERWSDSLPSRAFDPVFA